MVKLIRTNFIPPLLSFIEGDRTKEAEVQLPHLLKGPEDTPHSSL
jgi:hypothetical protein